MNSKNAFFAGLVLLMGSFASAAATCPNNDFKACESVLKKTHDGDKGKGFISAFNDICMSNSKFKCVKMTVMGDVSETVKELKTERKGATLFEVQQDDGKYIYIFEKQPVK